MVMTITLIMTMINHGMIHADIYEEYKEVDNYDVDDDDDDDDQEGPPDDDGDDDDRDDDDDDDVDDGDDDDDNGNNDDNDDDDSHSHHDKIPPWWENVGNEKGGFCHQHILTIGDDDDHDQER